jgi:hypothetical protein
MMTTRVTGSQSFYAMTTIMPRREGDHPPGQWTGTPRVSSVGSAFGIGNSFGLGNTHVMNPGQSFPPGFFSTQREAQTPNPTVQYIYAPNLRNLDRSCSRSKSRSNRHRSARVQIIPPGDLGTASVIRQNRASTTVTADDRRLDTGFGPFYIARSRD